jgi:hypothetical protein
VVAVAVHRDGAAAGEPAALSAPGVLHRPGCVQPGSVLPSRWSRAGARSGAAVLRDHDVHGVLRAVRPARGAGMTYNHEPRPVSWGFCARCYASGPVRHVAGCGPVCRACQPNAWDTPIGELYTGHSAST